MNKNRTILLAIIFAFFLFLPFSVTTAQEAMEFEGFDFSGDGDKVETSPAEKRPPIEKIKVKAKKKKEKKKSITKTKTWKKRKSKKVRTSSGKSKSRKSRYGKSRTKSRRTKPTNRKTTPASQKAVTFDGFDLTTDDAFKKEEEPIADTVTSKKPKKQKIIEVASLDVKPLGVDKDLAESLSQILASRLGEYKNMKVVSKAEMKAMIGFEFEKKAMGCSDDISCLAEVGGAMGVDYIVSGTLGKMKKTFVLNLMMINIKRARVKNRVGVTWKGDSAKLIELMAPYVKLLIEGEPATKYRGKLDLLVSQDAAKVYLDDQEKGQTPLKMQLFLPIGKHTVKLSKKGFVDYEQDVVIRKGLANVLTVRMIDEASLRPWYKKWWVWTIVGTVVASGVAGTVYLTRSDLGATEPGRTGASGVFPDITDVSQ